MQCQYGRPRRGIAPGAVCDDVKRTPDRRPCEGRSNRQLPGVARSESTLGQMSGCAAMSTAPSWNSVLVDQVEVPTPVVLVHRHVLAGRTPELHIAAQWFAAAPGSHQPRAQVLARLARGRVLRQDELSRVPIERQVCQTSSLMSPFLGSIRGLFRHVRDVREAAGLSGPCTERRPETALTAVRDAVGHDPATGREKSFPRLDLSVRVGAADGEA